MEMSLGVHVVEDPLLMERVRKMSSLVILVALETSNAPAAQMVPGMPGIRARLEYIRSHAIWRPWHMNGEPPTLPPAT